MCNIIENHDEPRGVSRYLPDGECSEDAKKALATLMMMVRGLPFIYQGQEIGMTNCEFPTIDDIDDLNTVDEYHVALRAGLSEEEALRAVERYSRDNSRTPFQWSDEEQAGFTTGTPWLMVNPNYTEVNARVQMQNPDSLYYWYKQLIALRKNPEYQEAVVYGEFCEAYKEESNLMAFYRAGEEKKLLVLANFQKESRELPFADKIVKILMNSKDALNTENGKVCLEGYQAVILEVAKN